MSANDIHVSNHSVRKRNSYSGKSTPAPPSVHFSSQPFPRLHLYVSCHISSGVENRMYSSHKSFLLSVRHKCRTTVFTLSLDLCVHTNDGMVVGERQKTGEQVETENRGNGRKEKNRENTRKSTEFWSTIRTYGKPLLTVV